MRPTLHISLAGARDKTFLTIAYSPGDDLWEQKMRRALAVAFLAIVVSCAGRPAP